MIKGRLLVKWTSKLAEEDKKFRRMENKLDITVTKMSPAFNAVAAPVIVERVVWMLPEANWVGIEPAAVGSEFEGMLMGVASLLITGTG
jgi:hypothetical protein